MRQFLLLALKAPTSRQFSWSESSEAALACRTVYNTFWASKGIRRDTILHLSLNGAPAPPKLVTFKGAELENFPAGEEEVAAVIRKALTAAEGFRLGEKRLVQAGVEVAKRSFESLVQEKAAGGQLFYLHKKGKDLRAMGFSGEPMFIFGDLFGIPHKTEKLLKRHAERLSLGPVMLFAAHCPILVHNELDRRMGKELTSPGINP